MRHSAFAKPLAIVLLAAFATSASAQLAITANDAKVTLANGAIAVVANAPPDTVAIVDLASARVLSEIALPNSVMGPPSGAAFSPDGAIALVTSSFKLDATGKNHIPDNRVFVLDLKASPPVVLSTVECGASPSGVSFNKAGTLALAANRSDGTVCVMKVSGQYVTRIDTVTIGGPTSGPSHAVFTPDGKMALVTKDNDNAVAVLTVDGDKVTYGKRDLFAGIRSYGIVMSPDGKSAVVANVGRGVGDNDSIASIDLTGKWPRVVEHLTVGQQAEGISMSADGKWVAVTVVNSSNKAPDFPWYSPTGKIVLVRIDGTKLTKVSEAATGAWCQGSGFTADNKRLYAQSPLDKSLYIFDIDGAGQLKDSGKRVVLKGAPVGMRVLGAP